MSVAISWANKKQLAKCAYLHGRFSNIQSQMIISHETACSLVLVLIRIGQLESSTVVLR